MSAQLQSIPIAKAAATTVPSLITIDELGERWKLSRKTLLNACNARTSDPLPVIRIGRLIRFNPADPRLAQWLERRTTGSPAR